MKMISIINPLIFLFFKFANSQKVKNNEASNEASVLKLAYHVYCIFFFLGQKFLIYLLNETEIQ